MGMDESTGGFAENTAQRLRLRSMIKKKSVKRRKSNIYGRLSR